MNISIFDVIGPIMIGPSSSHTAGAARLGRACALLCAQEFSKAKFSLHGSFYLTGKGHGTHEALLAGSMGMHEDDENIKNAFEIAKKQGIAVEFDNIIIQPAHENTAQITFYCNNNKEFVAQGSSVGGGRILITRINGMPVSITAERPTMVIMQKDEPGVVSDISRLFALNGINIALMQVTREEKGKTACTVVETDGKIPSHIKVKLLLNDNILSACILDMEA